MPELFTAPLEDFDAELDQRADEAARLVVSTIFPDIYSDSLTEGTDRFIPDVYKRMARIIIQAIEEGLV